MSGVELYHNLGVLAYALMALYVLYPFFRPNSRCRECRGRTEWVYSHEEYGYVHWCKSCDLYQ